MPPPQTHLTKHVASLNSSARQDIVVARGVYHDYKDTMVDMMEAGGDVSIALEKMGDTLVKEAKVSFLMVVEKKEDILQSEEAFKLSELEDEVFAEFLAFGHH